MKTLWLFKSSFFLVLALYIPLLGGLSAQTLKFNTADKIFYIDGTLPPLHAPGAYYKVFVNTGEGHYFIGDLDNPNNPDPDLGDFVYSGGIGANAYAELTPAYDDTHPPNGFYYIPGNITPQTGTAQALPMTGALYMEANRSIVPGDEITFVATIKNHCSIPFPLTGDLTLTYDASIFDPVSPMTVSISNLADNEQKSVFFTLKTKTTAILGTSPSPAPKVSFVGNPGNPCVIPPYTMTGMSVLASHDPNHKFANVQVVSQIGQEIVYEVTFQNNGAGPEGYVVVNDELDTYLKDEAPVIVPPYPNELVNTSPQRIAPRTWQWQFYFATPGLRGTKEADYLTVFPESDTKRSFRFKVKLDTFAPCNAVFNRATIYFKCQPPIETELSVTTIPCTQSDTINTCGDVSRKWLPGWSGLADGAPLPALLSPDWFVLNDYDPAQGWRYKWYPSENLTASWQLNPGLKMARTGVYALVVSRSCQSKIFLVPVVTTTGVQTNSLLVQDNPNDCMADLFIWGSVPPYTVTWNFTNSDGTTGTASGTFLDLTGKSGAEATVTDSLGCSVVFTPIAANCGNDFPCWAIWLAVIAAIVAGIILYLKKSKKFNA